MSGGPVVVELNSFYVGIIVENVLYGFELLLYLKTLHVLLSNKGYHKRSNIFYAVFSTIMLFLVTVWVVTQALFNAKLWTFGPDFPGGPSAYWNANISIWYMEWSKVAGIILQIMTDALMVYRCRTVLNNNHAVIVPAFLWLVTLALGITIAWRDTLPDDGTCITAKLELTYWSIAVFLNTALTIMICSHVVRHGRVVHRHLGREYASLYFVIATIMIESVLPYTLCGVVFIGLLFGMSPLIPAFYGVYTLTMCISPQMLILRVMSGNALHEHSFDQAHSSTLKFKSEVMEPGSGPRWSERNVQDLSNAFPLGDHEKASISEA